MALQQSQCLRLEIDSKLTNTTLVAMAVRGLCSMTTLSPVEINRLELCLVEVVNNAIEHAYDNQAGHPVEVTVEMMKESMTLVVSDQGHVMPRETLEIENQPQIDPDSPQSWLCSGRGLHIVKNLMDTVEYSSDQGKNSLRMTKLLRY